MRLVRRLGVKTSGRQRLAFGRVKGRSVTRVPDARKNGNLARVRMEMRRQFEPGREFKTQCVWTRLTRIANQVDLLHSRQGQSALRTPLHFIGCRAITPAGSAAYAAATK